MLAMDGFLFGMQDQFISSNTTCRKTGNFDQKDIPMFGHFVKFIKNSPALNFFQYSLVKTSILIKSKLELRMCVCV